MTQIGLRARRIALALATPILLGTASIGGVAFAAAQDDRVRPVVDDAGVPQVRFNFKQQSWDQVLDYFSRATGMPIVRAVQPPSGTVDYFHPTPYPLPKALETLNILLQTRDVMLRQEDGRLVLDALDESKRVNLPTFVGELPADVTPDTVITLIMPLVNATAADVAEQLKDMVGGYGMLIALPEQNSLLVVETAANVQNRPAAVIARCLAHMDFVAADVRTISYGGRRHLGQGLFSGKHRFDIKMAKPFSSSL